MADPCRAAVGFVFVVTVLTSVLCCFGGGASAQYAGRTAQMVLTYRGGSADYPSERFQTAFDETQRLFEAPNGAACLEQCLADDNCVGVFDWPRKKCYGLASLGSIPVATGTSGLSYSKTYAPLYTTVFTGKTPDNAGQPLRFTSAFSDTDRVFNVAMPAGSEERCLAMCAGDKMMDALDDDYCRGVFLWTTGHRLNCVGLKYLGDTNKGAITATNSVSMALIEPDEPPTTTTPEPCAVDSDFCQYAFLSLGDENHVAAACDAGLRVTCPTYCGLGCTQVEPSPVCDKGQHGVCTVNTVCSAEEYEEVAPGFLRDRKCLPLDTCMDGYYEYSPPLYNVNRVCAPIDECDETEYETQAPTASSNRLCALKTLCAANEYVAVEATATSDRVCERIRACGPGFEEVSAPSATADRLCMPCDGITKFSDDDADCRPVTPCAEGTYERTPPSSTQDRLCFAITTCEAGQWEAVAPTATSDRRCRDASVCGADQYEFRALAATADRVCRNVSPCNADEYETKEPTSVSDRECDPLTVCDLTTEYHIKVETASSDRVCAPLTVCQSNEYQFIAPTITSDRLCKKRRGCLEGEYESSLPTDVSDRICSPISPPCGDGLYELEEPSVFADRKCAPVDSCDVATQYEVSAPTYSSNRVCATATACVVGVEYESVPLQTFEDRKCEPISPLCVLGETYEESAPTPVSDRVCLPVTTCTQTQMQTVAPTYSSPGMCQDHHTCDPDTEYEVQSPTATSDRFCEPLTQCEDDEVVVVRKTATSDRTCEKIITCTAEEYETDPLLDYANRKCAALTVCDDFEYEKTKPSPVSDRKCVKITVCSADQYETKAPTGVTDRQCADLTECGEMRYETEEPTATRDRKCEPLTECKSEEYEYTAPTDTTDRVCKSLTICEQGQFVQVPASASSDRVCEDHSPCTAGEYELAKGTAQADFVCAPVTPCAPETQYTVTEATATSNTVCSPLTVCKDGKEYESVAASVSSDRKCSPVTTCASSSNLVTAIEATKVSDAVCGCRPGTWSSDVGSITAHVTSCTVYTHCESMGLDVDVAATPSSDEVCKLSTGSSSLLEKYGLDPEGTTWELNHKYLGDFTPDEVAALASAIYFNDNLLNFGVQNTGIDASFISAIAPALAAHQNLQTLNFDYLSATGGYGALTEVLRTGPSLSVLTVRSSQLSSADLTQLASAISLNPSLSLKRLNVADNPEAGLESAALALATAVGIDGGITTLLARDVGLRGTGAAFATALAQNQALVYADFRANDFTPEEEAALVEAWGGRAGALILQ
eukprot:UC1_evm4s2028